jgi:outer membrane lipoprotein SlyB
MCFLLNLFKCVTALKFFMISFILKFLMVGEIMKITPIMAAALIATALVSGCASPDYYPSSSQAYPSSSSYSTVYGTIESIQMVRVDENRGPGAGALVGGIVGGILGNQIGGGTGNAVATVAGAVGGAVVGNQIEKNSNHNRARDMYQINIRLDNGSYQTVVQDAVNDLHVGNRIRIENDRVYRY